MESDWFDGGGIHVKSVTTSTRFAIGDKVVNSKEFIKKAKRGYFGVDALQELGVATIVGFEHDSGSEYASGASYVLFFGGGGKVFHRNERWITKVKERRRTLTIG